MKLRELIVVIISQQICSPEGGRGGEGEGREETQMR